MEIFIDSADVEEIREAAAMGLVDGVTTNPTLVAKSGRNMESVIKEICDIVDGPVSAEVISTDCDGMVAEGEKLSAMHPNVVVKIPLIAEGLKAVRQLAQQNIHTNVTLCFSAPQALLAAKAGATYVSPFVGRIDDISGDGMELIEQIVSIYANYALDTKVLAASVRHPMHVVDAALAGSHAATLPWGVIDKLLSHPLTDRGLQRFLEDAKRIPGSS